MHIDTPGSVFILILTVVISLIGLYARPALIHRCLFRPHYLIRDRQYHTLLSSGLVHGSVAHLLFNMLTFYFFAPPLERVMGTPRFMILYVLALICSEARTYLQQRNNPRYAALGASGAISAVLFAAIIYFPDQSLYILPIPLPIPAPVFAVCYLIYSWYLSRHGQDNVNHSAHLDGALFGLLFVAATDADAYRRLSALIVQ